MKEASGKKNLLIILPIAFLAGGLLIVFFTVGDNLFRGSQASAKDGLQTVGLYRQGKGSLRNKILDRNYSELAVSFRLKSVCVRPLEIENPVQTADFLAGSLDLDKKGLLRDLKSERGVVWLRRGMLEARLVEIQRRNIRGVYIVNEDQRYYPLGRNGAHVIGFLKDGHGLAGIEAFYDRKLRGTVEKSVAGEQEEVNGHLVLSVDLRLQQKLEDVLSGLLKKTDAATGSGLLIDPLTGEILAMANLPAYDPNYFWDFKASSRKNRVIEGKVNCGGIQKVFRLAAAYESVRNGLAAVRLELQLANLANSVDENPRLVAYKGGLVSRELAWRDEFSVGEQEMADFLKRLGLSAKREIDLPMAAGSGLFEAEAGSAGDDLGDDSGLYASPVQLMTGFSRLITGGVKSTLHLGTGVIDPKSGNVTDISPSIITDNELEAAGKVLRELLKEVSSSSAKTPGIFLESLQPYIDQVDYLPTTIENQTLKNNDSTQKQQEIDARYNALLIGYEAVDKPSLVMLISLEKASIETDKKTPTRTMAEKNFRTFIEMASRKESEKNHAELFSGQESLYKEWLESREVLDKSLANNRGRKADLMPSLKNMSLRKALQVLQPYDLQVKVKGSGRVVSQVPSSGVELTGDRCELTLQAI